jgi:hypothetical protein
MPADFAHRGQTWPRAVPPQRRTRRQMAWLDTPMAALHRAHTLWAVARWRQGEDQRASGLELRLVVLDEQAISAPRLHHRLCPLAVGEQGIHRHEAAQQDAMASNGLDLCERIRFG